MNAERLLRHFETISETPDAVARLRRFILDLAVRGKLVEQDPEDEPAEELLKAISLDSSRSKGRRTAASLLPVIATEGSFVVPDSWVWTLLGAIGDWGSGSTPPRGRLEYYGGDISWFKSGELSDNKHLSDSEEKITRLALEQCSFRQNKPGDVLIAMYGATIGRLAILAEEAVTNQAVCACTPCWGVDTEYLYLFLLAKRDDFRLASEGGAQPNISKVKIVNTVIPLPPLAEQHRIVAKVDELMALCDQLEAARQQREQGRERLIAATLESLNQPAEDPASFRQDASFALQVLPSLTTTPAQIKQLRQTILNLAVRGKLVEQDPEDEPAENLLRAIMQRSEDQPFAKRRRSPRYAGEVTESEKYLCTPSSWTWARLNQLGQTQTGTSPSSANPDLFGCDIPFVKPSDLDGADVNYEGAGLSIEGIKHSRLARTGTILMVCIGATLGKINKTDRPVCFNQQINSLTPALSDYLEYIEIAMKCADFQSLAWTKAGTGTLPIVSKGKWELLPIPLPPLAEQHRIVAKVDELMALCDQLEQQLSQADQQRRRLLEAVLVEALLEPEQALAAMA